MVALIVVGAAPSSSHAAGLTQAWQGAGSFPDPFADRDPEAYPPNACRTGHMGSETDAGSGTIWLFLGYGCWWGHSDVISGPGDWSAVPGSWYNTGKSSGFTMVRYGPHMLDIGGNLNSGRSRLVYRTTEHAGGWGSFAYDVAGHLPADMESPGAAIHNNTLYVAGGIDYNRTPRREVWAATVYSTGDLGTFRLVSQMPAARVGHEMVVVRDQLYVIGGSPDDTGAVWGASVLGDGRLGAWRTEASLPVPLSHHSAVAIGNDIYVVGGGGPSGVARDETLVATANSSGSLSPWQVDSHRMPSGRQGHVAVALGSTLVVTGGTGHGDAITASTSSTESDAYLLDKYRPELRYDSQDAFRADSAATLTDNYVMDGSGRLVRTNKLNDARAKALAVSYPGDRAPDLNLGYLGSYPASSGHRLDAAGTQIEQAIDAIQLHSRPEYRNVLYGRAVDTPYGGKVLQYWAFYYYNPKTYFTVGAHEGDWEMVQVHLDPLMRPTEATAAQHGWGERCPWVNVQRTGADRPIIYVAEGSHASYFSSGRHLNPEPGNPAKVADDTSGGDGETVVPTVVNVDPTPPWLLWPGKWGNSDNSPGGPASQSKWADPWGWSHGSGVKDCTEEQEQSLQSRQGTQPTRSEPAVSALTAEMQDGEIVFRYSDADPRALSTPTMLLATVDRAGSAYPPLTRRSTLRARNGTVKIPLPPGSGKLALRASTLNADTGRSETVAVTLR